jgi:ribosomal protein S18 acetylase RimI-like enzyme
MIRNILPDDKTVFLSMAKDFYSSDAVAHNVESRILEAVFDAAVSKSPYIRALIIEDGNNPVGFALLSFSFATEVGGLSVQLEDLYISDTCRGKGLGSKFMAFMESEYPSAKRFRLEVAKDNTGAIDLYRRLGYEVLEYVQMVKDGHNEEKGRSQ